MRASQFWLLLPLLLAGCSGYPRFLGPNVDPSGSGLNSTYADENPQIGPEGRFVLFTSDRKGSRDVFLYDNQNQRLLEMPGLNGLDSLTSHPVASADAKWLVFAANRQGRAGIYLYNRETQQLQNLTQGLNSDVRNPTISADGSTIAFESSVGGQWDILVYNRATGQPLENLPLAPR
ncbi:TolB family protein [Leptolyngbya sp. FACHB-261]|nr:TolB family protein [Leptolyngbya sp. FACHB-261]